MKKNKKIVILVLIILMSTGCTINYNLEINETEIIENIDVVENGTNISETDAFYNSYIQVYDDEAAYGENNYRTDEDGTFEYEITEKTPGVAYHEKTKKTIDGGYNYAYNYTYPIDRFQHANTIHEAFNKPKVYNATSYLNIKTDDINLLCAYEYIDSLTINIKVDREFYNVTQNNAHSINGNVYTWYLDDSNCNDSSIAITMEKIKHSSSSSASSSNNKKDNKKSKLDDYVLYIFAGIIVILILIGYRMFNKMKDKNNQIDD